MKNALSQVLTGPSVHFVSFHLRPDTRLSSKSDVASQRTLQLTTIGFVSGCLSALLYTITNICLRQVAGVDPVWVSTVKAIPTLIMVLPVVLWTASQGSPNFSRRSHVVWLVLTAIAVQIFGNVGFQYALSILGLTISVPIVLGTMLVGGALIGKWVLGEPVGLQKAIAVVILIVATVALSYGAQDQAEVVSTAATLDENAVQNVQEQAISTSRVAYALIANVLSGLAYAVLGTMMRRSMQSGMSMAATLLVLSSVGTLMLFGWSLWRIGWNGIAATPAADLTFMIVAGVFNALAFVAMAKSLKEIPVLWVQILNASQAAISAGAGWYFFGESLTFYILLGLSLTAFGMVVAGFRKRKPKLK